METIPITVQNTEREGALGEKASQSMRSDRNEDTMRPLAEDNDIEEGLE
jgi:hypothetical protein